MTDLTKAPPDSTELNSAGTDLEGGMVFHDAPQQPRPHVFVVMPFGKKKGADGQVIDFNAIYTELIKPALEQVGFEPFRADEETSSGDILTDMFQELLLADLVVADLSIDNANVFYELGVRHALRKRGIVHIQSGRAYMPFDIFNVRTIPYHLNDVGVPDAEFLEKDRQAIARSARDTWTAEREAVHSPIFNLLDGLPEPDRKLLKTPLASGFWAEYDEWKHRVEVAQRQKRIGDILLLTEEINNPVIKEEAIVESGKALRNMGLHELALQQYRQGLELNPDNRHFRREEAFHLNRLGRVDEAIVRLEQLIASNPKDTDACSYLGRTYKDVWTANWINHPDPKTRLEQAFEAYHWLVKSIQTYLKGYRSDLDQYYPGVNALTLATILISLADKFDDPDDPDPDIAAIRDLVPQLKGALEFGLETQVLNDKQDYWTLVSLAELMLITAEKPVKAVRAYRKAMTAAQESVFYLQSSLAQLKLLETLELRGEFVQACMEAIRDEIQRMSRDEPGGKEEAQPTSSHFREGQAILFSGHCIDGAGGLAGHRPRRFPQELEAELRQKIEAMLDELEADSNDIAFTAGAGRGSEIMFIEACLARNISVEVHLPMSEAAYIRRFIHTVADNRLDEDSWIERYYALRSNPHLRLHVQEEKIGQPPPGVNLYERNNRWAMYSALIKGISRLRLIAVWDGKAGDDLDGKSVCNMVAQVQHLGGRVVQINPIQLNGSKRKK